MYKVSSVSAANLKQKNIIFLDCRFLLASTLCLKHVNQIQINKDLYFVSLFFFTICVYPFIYSSVVMKKELTVTVNTSKPQTVFFKFFLCIQTSMQKGSILGLTV